MKKYWKRKIAHYNRLVARKVELEELQNKNRFYSKLAWPMRVVNMGANPKKKIEVKGGVGQMVKRMESKRPDLKNLQKEANLGGYFGVKLHSFVKRKRTR